MARVACCAKVRKLLKQMDYILSFGGKKAALCAGAGVGRAGLWGVACGIFGAVLLLSGCASVRLPPNTYLLSKNTIKVDAPPPNSHEKELARRAEVSPNLAYGLEKYTKQRPNSMLFSVLPFRLWLYELSSPKDSSKFNRWLRNKAGEMPVVFDSVSEVRSAVAMTNYLRNLGYFEATTTTEVKQSGRRATAVYTAHVGTQYRVKTLDYKCADSTMLGLLHAHDGETLLKADVAVSADNMELERRRVVRMFRENGYFSFGGNFVTFVGDSTPDKQINVHLLLDLPASVQYTTPYQIRKVRIYPAYDATIPLALQACDSSQQKNDVQFCESGVPSIRHKVLANSVFIRHGRNYDIRDHERTLLRLRELGMYRFTEIRFTPVDSLHALDAQVLLSPSKKLELGYGAEFNTADFTYAVGTTLSFNLKNRNTFRGADLLSFGVEGGIDVALPNAGQQVSILKSSARGQLELQLPRLLVPFALNREGMRTEAKTRITAVATYQKLVNFYEVTTLGATFGYDWRESPTQRHSYNPVGIALQRIAIDASFEPTVASRPFLAFSLRDRYIIGSNYIYTYAGLPLEKAWWSYFRSSIDLSGNLVWAADRLLGHEQSTTVLGVPYSQFARAELDGHLYRKFGKTTSFAARLTSGVGLAYGVSEQTGLPYSKKFYGGGPNGIRGWALRTLGPGGVHKNTNDDLAAAYEAGDFRLEANAELRFKIYSAIYGALFVDAGNVWAVNKDETRADAQLNARSWQEVAIGSGFGLRFDFSYFILRFDFGLPLRYPYPQREGSGLYAAESDGGRYWKYASFADFTRYVSIRDAALNIAVGYPF